MHLATPGVTEYTVDNNGKKSYKIPMFTTLALYLIGIAITASLLMAWFNTPLPIHVLYRLKALGWKKQDSTFWSTLNPEWESTWLDFENVMNDTENGIPAWLCALVQCKYCFSFHIAFWVSLVLAITFSCGWEFVALSTFSWPIFAILVYNKS